MAGATSLFQEEPSRGTRHRGNELLSLLTIYQRGAMLKESRGPHQWSSQLHRTPFCAGTLQGWTTRLNLHRLLHRCSCGKKMLCFPPPKCSFAVSLKARCCSLTCFQSCTTRSRDPVQTNSPARSCTSYRWTRGHVSPETPTTL